MPDSISLPDPIDVLVIDDDRQFGTFVRLLLERANGRYRVEIVTTADEGIRSLIERPPHICLLDYNLGTQNGVDVLRRAFANRVTTPIVLLTAEGSDAIDLAAISEGAADYLDKAELEPDRLARLVNRVITRARAEVSLRQRENELSRAEDALATSQARYASMLRRAPFGIFEATADGHMRGANPSLVAMLGFGTEQELREWSPDVLFGGRDERQRVLSHLTECVAIETLLTRRDGSKILARLTVDRLLGGEGTILGIAEDITQSKKLEEQLRQAQKMEAVGRLAGGIAHDFNNLLTAILGYADLLKERCRAANLSDLVEDLDEIDRAGRSAASLTEQLLAFSRKQMLKPEVISVNDTIAGLQKLLPRVLGEDVRLEVALGSRVPRVEVDPVQLQQVILNMAVNSRDAMPRGGRLTIRTDQHVATGGAHTAAAIVPGRYLVIQVSDTGHGMDASTRMRIFEPFFTTKGPGKGTGLGLATAYGIIRQSGGDILCQSQPGEGTTFSIYLPASDKTLASDAQHVPALGSATGRILLVEDQGAVRRLTRRILESHGLQVLEAADPEAALTISRLERFDLLLTDVVMPQMSGPELAKRIRREVPGVKVLFMSGFVGHSALEDISGMPLLHKPFSPRALLTKLTNVMSPVAST